jgi:hypothetical protein
MIRHIRLALVVGAAVLAAGCGSARGRVTGTVSYQKKPVAAGTVTFYVVGHAPVAATIADGKYEAGEVPAGEAAVSVSCPSPEPAGQSPSKKPRPGQRLVIVSTPPLGVPTRYADPDSSGLKTTVEKGQNTFPIELD